MTAQKFVEVMQSYYVQYKPIQLSVVMDWAKGKSPEWLKTLARVCVETISTKFGTVPGIPEFNELAEKVEMHMEQEHEKRKALARAEENRKLLVSSEQGGVWDEVEYNGRKMTRASAAFEAMIEGMARGIKPADNEEVKRITQSGNAR